MKLEKNKIITETRKKCPICESHNISSIRSRYNFTLSFCKTCSFMFVKEYFDYNSYYDAKYFRNYTNPEALFDENKDSLGGDCSYEKNKEVHRGSYEGGFRALKKFINPTGVTYLDVGCAEGFGLELAEKHGAAAVGIDVSASVIERCRNKGINNVFIGELSDCRFSNIKMATMIDVLEHMQDPVLNLRALNKIMSLGGFVFVKNNLFSLDLFLNNEDYFFRHFEPPYHCSYFSEDKMVEIFRETGFELVYKKPRFIFYLFETYAYLKGLLNKEHREFRRENKKKRQSLKASKKFSTGSFWGKKIEEIFPGGFVFKKVRNIDE